MKTILPIAVLGSLLMSSCASLVAFNAQYNTDVTEPEVTYAAPKSSVVTEAPAEESQVVTSDTETVTNDAETVVSEPSTSDFYDDDYYYSRRLMTSYDPTWDVSFRIGGPWWSVGYYPFGYHYYNDYYYCINCDIIIFK